MTYLIAALSTAGICLIGYGLFLAWPPLCLVASGLTLLRVTWSLDDGGDE
jgi:hypothetical protein